jgi:hypothetical protein
MGASFSELLPPSSVLRHIHCQTLVSEMLPRKACLHYLHEKLQMAFWGFDHGDSVLRFPVQSFATECSLHGFLLFVFLMFPVMTLTNLKLVPCAHISGPVQQQANSIPQEWLMP